MYPNVRPAASYLRSLELLARAKKHRLDIPVKSGIMLSLGESADEIKQTLADMIDAGCRILTMGQYLQQTIDCLPVARFVPSEEFERWREVALKMGFAAVASAPLVRSSYRAEELYDEAKS